VASEKKNESKDTIQNKMDEVDSIYKEASCIAKLSSQLNFVTQSRLSNTPKHSPADVQKLTADPPAKIKSNASTQENSPAKQQIVKFVSGLQTHETPCARKLNEDLARDQTESDDEEEAPDRGKPGVR
jgi:hypothetical protein